MHWHPRILSFFFAFFNGSFGSFLGKLSLKSLVIRVKYVYGPGRVGSTGSDHAILRTSPGTKIHMVLILKYLYKYFLSVQSSPGDGSVLHKSRDGVLRYSRVPITWITLNMKPGYRAEYE